VPVVAEPEFVVEVPEVPVWLAFWSVVLDGVIVVELPFVPEVAVPVVSVELVPELVVLVGCCVVGCADWSVVADGVALLLFVFWFVVLLVVCADATPSASAKTDIGNRSLFIVFGSLKKGQFWLPCFAVGFDFLLLQGFDGDVLAVVVPN
jgi:hypothetical protein